MTNLSHFPVLESKCGACTEGETALFPFTMAFQPIVDAISQTVFAYESLVRGPNNESAFSILSQVTESNRYLFDQSCRVKAIQLAASLNMASQGAKLSVNFMPGAVYSPTACIQKTLQTARATGFPLDALIFEITEDERVNDADHLQGIVTEYQKHGFALALDDFGAGYSGLNSLSRLDVDIVKLDAQLIRDIHKSPRARTIVRSIVEMCRQLNVQVIGEAVETLDEYDAMLDCGIRLMQGYLFARPQFEALPQIAWPASTRSNLWQTAA